MRAYALRRSGKVLESRDFVHDVDPRAGGLQEFVFPPVKYLYPFLLKRKIENGLDLFKRNKWVYVLFIFRSFILFSIFFPNSNPIYPIYVHLMFKIIYIVLPQLNY